MWTCFWSLILASNAGVNPKLSLVQIWYWQKLFSRPSIFIISRKRYKICLSCRGSVSTSMICKILFFHSVLQLQLVGTPAVFTSHYRSKTLARVSHHLGIGMARAHFKLHREKLFNTHSLSKLLSGVHECIPLPTGAITGINVVQCNTWVSTQRNRLTVWYIPPVLDKLIVLCTE